MEPVLTHPKMRYALKEYVQWYNRHFLPAKQYQIFLRFEGGKMCIYFSYDLTDEIDDCIRKCKKSRDYDDCFMECYEDVVDAAEEFLFEQPDEFEKLLRKRGIKADSITFDYDWGGGDERAIRWARLCIPY
jgi:hypothetical protein